MYLWDSGRVLRAWLGCEQLFPLVIPAGAPTPSQLARDSGAVLVWKRSIEEHCQCHSGHGYRIEYTETDHAHPGLCRLPERLIFDQVSDLIAFIDKGREVKRFALLLGRIRKSDPRVLPWVEQHPMKALEYGDGWEQLLLVLDYLQKNSMLSLELNDRPMPSEKHKFIQQNKLLITQLLEYVSPGEAKTRQV